MAFNSIRGLQINVNHCEAAHTGVFQVAWDLKLDFIAIQDPYLVKGEPPSANFGCKVFMSQSRKAILYILNKNFNVFFKFNTTNTVVVELHFNNFLLNIFNCYFPPNDDIEDLLNEWGGFNFLNSFNLLIGDFNCRSSSWGYDSDNYRGRKFMEFIASSNLHVCNISEYGPTFQSTINVGFPDLTLISSSIANYVKNWGVLDTETHSYHKYIYFNIEIDNIPETDFYFKSKYSQNKFMKYIKRHLGPLREKLKLANNTVHLNDLFNELTSVVQKGAFKTLKKKPKKLAKKFSFWNEDLRLTRNKVNKLFKIYRKHKAENSNVDLIQSSGNAYRRERAVFKKLLLKTKRKAWEDFCVNYNDRYGSLSKLVFNKSTGENSIGVSPNNDPNNPIVDRITHIMDFFFPGKSPDDNFVFNPIVGPISSLTIEDLEITFGNLKGGKAPGLDRIDYRMWRAVFITDKIFMLDLFNRCFILNYFPRCLRNARVFFLLKDGKDPGLCNSYRPVCLLPTLGKIVERLFLIKLNGWLDQHNIIHDNQYGFREGRSCDLAIHTPLVETMKFKMNTDHLALVSLDIKLAFDNMNWSVLFKIFNDIGLPSFYRNFIFYYLCDRTVLYINDVCETTRHL
ncbi:Retrovirus-related Pol polyprotein from type-1 retrotransposable element R1 [Araneus ventricosus]|uniref:Retrovirus-related Pol polyprotein from type-1 retrotransposable element R1 n=1 Tax=Araneus ventricosus TaxID=182803 RepID=A0A4Y1ZJY6_ARAVE|nr:Retrovirus-related Pol polyprotein from type-1 retrotransposable element R1 [Araneus ventricosus]